MRFFMMAGNRGETPEAFRRSVDFLETARPDEYVCNSLLDEIPVCRGKVILVQRMLLDHVDKDPVARRLLRNMIQYAHSAIKPGLDHRSVGRPMDPISEP